MNNKINDLINAHKVSETRLENEKAQLQVKTSKLAGFLGGLYESVRNAVDEELPHLLRKRAIKRILIREKAFYTKYSDKSAEILYKELIWGKYLNNLPTPVFKIQLIANVLNKYKYLIYTYKTSWKLKPKKRIILYLYGLCAVEIERIFEPYLYKDKLVDLEFSIINKKGILSDKAISNAEESINNYVAIHKACLKSDNDFIKFHLFGFKFPFWGNPSKEQFKLIAANLEYSFNEIDRYLEFQIKKKKFKEIIRQSIPFKIFDLVIKNNLGTIEQIIQNKDTLNLEIDKTCDEEYKKNRKKLTKTIVGSIIYIFTTKVLLAFLIEIPYELSTHGEVNYLTLGINILFPTIIMFIVASSFKIPNVENTKQLKQMIHSIISKDLKDEKVAFHASKLGYTSRFIFTALYYSIFILIFAAISFILYLLNFSVVGMAIFIIFFCTIFFVANKIRNTSSELKVINTKPSVFSPLIDMISVPLLKVGQKLSESASNLNLFAWILDKFVEVPVKKFIHGLENWNQYISDAKEEIV